VHRVRRIKKRVARSETGSADGSLLFWREIGVPDLERESVSAIAGADDPEADWGDTFDVAIAFRRG
jgi:hypothetical protein